MDERNTQQMASLIERLETIRAEAEEAHGELLYDPTQPGCSCCHRSDALGLYARCNRLLLDAIQLICQSTDIPLPPGMVTE